LTVKKIKEMEVSERPRERFLKLGPNHLSNTELLAIMLRTGTRQYGALQLAQEILDQSGGLKALNEATPEELMKLDGVGQSKAVMILAGLEMGRRIMEAQSQKSEMLLSPEDGYQLLSPGMRHLTQEHFVVLFLDTKNYVIGKKTVFIGSLNKAIVHPREVFKEAIKRSSAAIVCAHNHPSGDPTPSAQDIQLTHRLEEVGELVGIKLVDHIIIGEGQFASLREMGYLG